MDKTMVVKQLHRMPIVPRPQLGSDWKPTRSEEFAADMASASQPPDVVGATVVIWAKSTWA